MCTMPSRPCPRGPDIDTLEDRWTRTSSSSVPGWPAWSRPPSWPTPGAGSCSSTRRTPPTSAARRSGRSAGCSSSTPPSSAGWACTTRSTWPGRTGRGRPGFDREREDHWPRQWARAYVEWAAGEKRSWLHDQGVRWFPVVGWAERGGHGALGPGNSVPRFHLTWGTGPGVVEPFARRVGEHVDAGRVDGPPPPPGRRADRDRRRRRRRARHRARAVAARPRVRLVAHGRRRVRADARRRSSSPPAASAATTTWSGPPGPSGWATYPEGMLTGVPAHVDGRMLAITEQAGASIVNRDRMWHYTEGVANWDPIWPGHGIRILPGPVVAVAGRDRAPAARPALPRVRHAGHARAHPAHRARRTPGSSSPRRSSRRSSRSPGPSRTPTSPTATCARSSAGCAAGRPARSRRSSATARTSSCATTCATSSTA